MSTWGHLAGHLSPPRSAAPAAAQPDGATIMRHLARLTAAYPAFAFGREPFGWRGGRWVAERRDPTASGLYVIITSDLMELHATLQRDQARHAR